MTNKRGQYDQARNIVAFADLGESNSHILNHNWVASLPYPSNRSNDLYDGVRNLGIRDIQQVSSAIEGYNDMDSGEDYEKIESARLLSSSEYTLNTSSVLSRSSLRSIRMRSLP